MKITASYQDFIEAIKESAGSIDAGWDVVIDLNDGEISCRHNSNYGGNYLALILGHYLDSDFDISDENIEKVLTKIENQYITNQKADKFNVNVTVNYNEADNSVQLEQTQKKEISFDDIPVTKFENKLKNDRKPSKIFTGRTDKLAQIKEAFEEVYEEEWWYEIYRWLNSLFVLM